MRSVRTSIYVLSALLLTAGLIAAPVRAAEEKKAETELAKHMETLGKTVKALKKSVKDAAKNEESLKLVISAQQDALASKGLLPAMLAKTPEADKAKVILGYRKAMSVVVAELCKLEQQLLEGKNEDATETLKNLKTLEDDGHEKYNP